MPIIIPYFIYVNSPMFIWHVIKIKQYIFLCRSYLQNDLTQPPAPTPQSQIQAHTSTRLTMFPRRNHSVDYTRPKIATTLSQRRPPLVSNLNPTSFGGMPMTPQNHSYSSINNHGQYQSLNNHRQSRETRLKQLIEAIQTKAPESRIQEEIGQLLMNYGAYQKIYNNNPDLYRALVRLVKVEEFGPGRIVTSYGDKADSTYFILKGSLGVYLKDGFSTEKAKYYKQEYGQELVVSDKPTTVAPVHHQTSTPKNQVVKKRSSIMQDNLMNMSFDRRKQWQYAHHFSGEEQFMEFFPDMVRVSCLKQEESADESALKKNLIRLATLLTEEPTILLSLTKDSFAQVMTKHENIHLMLDERIEFIKQYKLFESWGKRLYSLVYYFQRKKFRRGEYCYKEGSTPTGFYLILDGEVQMTKIITVKPEQQPQDHPCEPMQQTVSLGIIGRGGYFGEQELLNKSPRLLTVRPISATVMTLWLSKTNFFMLGYGSDFLRQLKDNMKVRIQQREDAVKRSLAFITKIAQEKASPAKTPGSPPDFSFLLNKSEKPSNFSKINNHRPLPGESEAIVFMHGNRIVRPDIMTHHTSAKRSIHQQDNDPAPSFSMLQSNKDMYNETLKKFRRYYKKSAPKYKPDVNWDMKRVWKVLNLQQILTEDTPVKKDEEAIKIYYKHNRLVNQINESKCIRPKTSSSTYKEKLRYINYLDEFNRLPAK